VTRPHASAAALGTSAALAAAFLAQPAPSLAADRSDPRARTTASRTTESRTAVSRSHAAYASAALRALALHHPHATANAASPSPARHVTLAVCHDCGASQALVRVLLRRLQYGQPLPSLHLYTDRSWPALDTLARRTRSTVVIISNLATRVGVTPAAIDSDSRTAQLGVFEVLALMASTASAASTGDHAAHTGGAPK
jgi:hypothetical protein